jgi:SAM-dependent methyltransferase
LEFWCGSGRFATLLNQNFAGKFDYVGIDLSEELLSYASEDNPNLTFFQWDITKLVKNFEQESFDLIVWTSSFQHIPTNKERSFLMKNFYRLLDYDGMLLMTNRSLSDWFVKKNWKIVMKAKIFSRFKWNSRDLMVPRTDENWKVYERFYHFFSLEELKNLADFAWLTLKANRFIDWDGNFINNEKISRSSFFVANKNPIINW